MSTDLPRPGIRCSILLVLLCLGTGGTGWAANVGCMVYSNNLQFSAEELTRLEAAPEIQYVGAQIQGPAPHHRAVAARLARAGKKLILQIWWGPEPPHSWSRFSMANIALDARIRADFWREVVDPIIDAVGAEHVHAAHLLEETGLCFATDMLVPGVAENLSDGTGGGYSSPFYTGYRGRDTFGGPWMLTLRRHNEDFRRFSGYDLFAAALWFQGVNYRPVAGAHGAFRHWVGQRVQALGNIRFAEHLHAKYPGMRVTTWDGPNFGGNVWADTPAMLNHIDGFTANCYSSPLRNYLFARTLRVLDADKELQFMSWVGRDNLDVNARRAMLASIYAAGADIVHLWEEPRRCYAREDLWQISRDLYGRFARLPVFRQRPAVFVVCGSWDVPSVFLKSFDAAHEEDAEGVGLGKYTLVLADGAEHPGLAEYVADGGLAAVFRRRPAFLDPDRVSGGRRIETDAGRATVVQHGKGTVLLSEPGTAGADDDAWQLFVYDRIDELMTSRGLAETFGKHFAPRDSGGRYFEMTSDDGAVSCWFHYDVGRDADPRVPVQGTDVLSGDVNPVLGPDRTAVIVAHRPLAEWQAPGPVDRARLVKPAAPGARRGMPELRELPPVHSLGPARKALDPPVAPIWVRDSAFPDWAVAECRYRLVLRVPPAPGAVTAQPLLLRGADLSELTGLATLSWSSVRAFAGQQEQPVQVDERDGTGRFQAKGNGRLDRDDELVLAVSQGADAPATYCLYYDSRPGRAPDWPAAAVTFERTGTDIDDAVLSNARLTARLKGPAHHPGENRLESHGAGAITELSLDGKPFTRIRHNWGNFFLRNPWAGDGNWSGPECIRTGPLRSIICMELPAFVHKDKNGAVTLQGGVVNTFAMYGEMPVLDVQQRVEYARSARTWTAEYSFYTTVGSEPDANDVLLVPVAGRPQRVAMQDVGLHGTRYREHRPEQGWMALLDPVEQHGCALFYARLPELVENLAWVDYRPRRQLTPVVTRKPDGYPLRLQVANRVMQTTEALVRRFRIVGLTTEDEHTVAAQYRVWGEQPARLGRIEVHVRD